MKPLAPPVFVPKGQCACDIRTPDKACTCDCTSFDLPLETWQHSFDLRFDAADEQTGYAAQKRYLDAEVKKLNERRRTVRHDATEKETMSASNNDRRTLTRHLYAQRNTRFDGLEKAHDRALALAVIASYGISAHAFRPTNFSPPLTHHSDAFLVGYAVELVKQGGFAVAPRADANDPDLQREAGAKALREFQAPKARSK